MWTSPATSQLSQQLGFEVGRDGVFQALSLVVHLVPFHAEHLSEHPLDQMMAKRELACDLASGRRQSHMAVHLHSHESVLFKAAQCHGHRRWRD